MSTKPFVIRWGIIGCGKISSSFVRDLVLSPSNRGTTDVAHAVAAVGSRSLDKANTFITTYCPEGGCAQKGGFTEVKTRAFGCYEDVYKDENVDVIYIGTPHSNHYEESMNALESGKHVLVEKTATLNQEEFKSLMAIAKEKKLFLMEAVWTRFFPLTYELEKLLFEEKAIGEIRRLQSDFSIDFIDVVDSDEHRMLNPNLAGGGLYDLGPYPLVWALLVLYHHPENGSNMPENIQASMSRYKTGVDKDTNWTLDFPHIGMTGARATLSTSIAVNTPKEVATRITGTMGEIILPWPTARPECFIIRRSKVGRGPQDYVEEVKQFPIEGMGLHWEADAVARDIRDGCTENGRMPHSDTLLELAIFEKIRRQGGYSFPEGLEKVKCNF